MKDGNKAYLPVLVLLRKIHHGGTEDTENKINVDNELRRQ
jgi:hypothetical protein